MLKLLVSNIQNLPNSRFCSCQIKLVFSIIIIITTTNIINYNNNSNNNIGE